MAELYIDREKTSVQEELKKECHEKEFKSYCKLNY